MMHDEFTGCKLAYIFEEKLLVYKRDDLPGIPFPGLWDFPGGGREGSESAEECVLRELKEEFSISFPVSRFVYKRKVPSHSNNGNAYFFVALGKQCEIDAISFGDEGQYWSLMPVQEYMLHSDGIPALKSRLERYLNQ